MGTVHEGERPVSEEIIFGGDAADIPAGTYPGRLARVGVAESNAWGEFRTWDFELDNGSTVGGSSSMKTGSKSKTGRWITALLGRKPDKGENVTKAIIGRPCLVVVTENDDGWPQVADVLPPMSGSVAAAPGPATESAPAAGPTPIVDDLPF